MLIVSEDVKDYLKQRIEEEKTTSFPKTILLDVISHCNLRCSMCYHKDMKRKPGIMPWDLYKKCIDEIAEKRPDSRVWLVAFGEPFILKDMPERIKYAKDKGLTDIVLNSNGTLINYDNAKAVIQAGLDAVYIGVDATSLDVYEQIRVNPAGASLQRTIDNILEYKKALDEFGNPSQKLFVQFVVMSINEHQKDDFIAFWKEKGVNVKVRPMISWAGKMEFNNLVQQIDRLPCKWMFTDLTVTYDGKIPYCANDQEYERCVADISDKPIEKIWNNELKKWRMIHLESRWNELPDFCKKCLDWQSGYANYI